MDIDALGQKSVSELIRQSGLPRFLIYRAGNVGRIPVFEHIKQASVEKAVDAFLSWAYTISSGGSTGAVYEILLFENVDVAVDEDGAVEVRGRSKKLNGKIRFTFALDKNHGSGYGSGGGPVDIKAAVNQAVGEILNAQKEDRLLSALEGFEKRLAALEEPDEDEDEDEGGGTLGAITGNPVVMGLLTRIFAGAPEASPGGSVLNGPPDPQPAAVWSEDERARINRACLTLRKHDEDLAGDLERLASLAEKRPKQFKFLVSTLRNM